MASWLKQSTSVDVGIGPFLDETDGKTAETGLTITQPDIRLKKNAGAWAQKAAAQTLTHEENGWYEVTLDATDTNTLGILIVAIHEAGALPVWREFLVVPANVWDSYLGADKLEVDLVQIVGVAQSATDLKDFADDGYDPATNKVEGVKLADTLTTYTGNTPQTGDSFARIGAPAGASIAADIAALPASIWNRLTSALTTAGSIGKLLVDNIDAAISSRLATAGYTAPPTAAQNADAVWDEAAADHVGAGSTGEALGAAGAAGDPWITALPGAYGAGTAGKIVGDNLNATVSSRATPAQVNAEADTALADARAGYVQAIWDALTSALTTVGSIGKLIVDNLNATVSSRASQASVDTIDDFLDTEIADILTDTGTTLDDLLDTEIAAILADTNELQTDWVDGGRLDLLIDAIKASTDPLNAAQTEPTGVPAANATPLAKVGYIFKWMRNRVDVTSTKKTFFSDAGAADMEKDLTDDGTTYSESEVNIP